MTTQEPILTDAASRAGRVLDRLGLSGLKGRLALLTTLVLLVPIILGAAMAIHASEDDEQRQQQVLERTLGIIAGYHDQVIQRAKQFLTVLAYQPMVREGSPEACRAGLQLEKDQSPIYLALARTDQDGTVICASDPALEGRHDGDKRWFTEIARDRRDVAFGSPDDVPAGFGNSIMLNVPVPGPDGGVGGALEALIAVDELLALNGWDGPPERMAIAIISLDGTISSIKGMTLDAAPDDEFRRQLIARPGILKEWRDPSGQAWRFIAKTAVYDDQVVTSIMVGLPKQSWSWLGAGFQAGIVLPSAILFLTLLVVWFATEQMVTGPVLRLAQAVRQWRDGSRDLDVDLSTAPVELRELAQAFTSSARDIHERDRLLRVSLDEKDLMLREIHHRVKNNLQIVTSLLNLRASALRHPQAVQAMRETQLSIRALALVHRKLYERADLRLVALDELLEELCPMVHELGPDVRAEVAVQLEPVSVTADQATPLVLMTTELLTNSIKHGFPEGSGTIVVRLHTLPDGQAELSVQDDGVGLSPPGDRLPSGLGTRLIAMFAKQAGGTLRVVSPGQGLLVALTFTPIAEPKPLGGRPRPT